MATRLDDRVRAARTARLRQVVADAERLCREKGERLTPVRREVLRLLARSEEPLGAYALLAQLRRQRTGRVDAPTVYRALDFLLKLGLATRIESRSAWVLVDRSARSDASVFFLCNTCNTSVAIENLGVADLIADSARSLGFQVNRPVIECSGTCASCSTPPVTTPTGQERSP